MIIVCFMYCLFVFGWDCIDCLIGFYVFEYVVGISVTVRCAFVFWFAFGVGL